MDWVPTDTELQQAKISVNPADIIGILFQNDRFLLDAIQRLGNKYSYDLQQEVELKEMYRLCSEATLLQCNHALSQAYEHIDRLQEQSMAKSLLLQRAEEDMLGWMEQARKDFETLGRRLLQDELVEGRSVSPAMDWEPAAAPLRLDYPRFLQEKVQAQELHLASSREDSVNIPATPVASRAVHPTDFTLLSESSVAGTPDPQPRTKTTRQRSTRTTTPPAAPQLEQAIGQEVLATVEKKMGDKFAHFSNELIKGIHAQLADMKAVIAAALAPTQEQGNPPPPPAPEPSQPPPPAPEPTEGLEGRHSQGRFGGNGGRGGGTGGGAPGGGDNDSSSSSSSEEDSEPDVARNPKEWKRWYKHKRALLKARRGKKKSVLSEDSDVEPRRKHHGRLEKVEAFSGEKSSYDVEDFLWNLESKFEIEAEAWKGNDRAKVRYASSCLTGKALNWFRSYRYQVNPVEAKRMGMDTQSLDPTYWSWPFFSSQLRRSFGNKDQKEKALKQWDSLRHTGSIDDFCDEIERLMWMVNFNQPAIEHKIRSSLSEELSRDWAKVQNKPETLRDQLSMLREMGRAIEKFKGATKKTDPTLTSTKRKREEEPAVSKPSKKSRSEPRPFGRFASKAEALKGIPKEVIDQRMKDRVCWRCGKSGHRAGECKATSPVVGKVAASGKKKEGKVSAATGSEETTQLVVAGSSSRIVEMSSDDDMMDA